MTLTVLHLAQPTDGGVAAVVADLAARQLAHGDQVVVACPARGRLLAEAAGAGARTIVWEASRSPGPSLRAEMAGVRRVLEQARPDVVHLHSSKAGLAGRMTIRGRRPTVFQPHAWSFAAVRGVTALASARWERHAARWTHRLICVSEVERRDGLAAGVHAPTSVIRNGVAVERFAADGPSDRAAARRELGLPLDAPLAVCVGRLCRQKGQDVLLAAWPGVRAASPQALLALVGDGPDAAALRSAAPPQVRFAGDVADPRPWYRAADVVVLPSRWEGMALAPLEAMATGRAVVLTDVPGAAECLPPGQVGEAIVPRQDPAALARAVTAMLLDRVRCDKLGGEALAHVREHHDARRVSAEVFDAYDHAMATWRARR